MHPKGGALAPLRGEHRNQVTGKDSGEPGIVQEEVPKATHLGRLSSAHALSNNNATLCPAAEQRATQRNLGAVGVGGGTRQQERRAPRGPTTKPAPSLPPAVGGPLSSSPPPRIGINPGSSITSSSPSSLSSPCPSPRPRPAPGPRRSSRCSAPALAPRRGGSARSYHG